MTVMDDDHHDGGADFFQHGSVLRDSGEADGGDGEIDQLDADERHDDAAEAVDQQIAPQDAGGADRAGRRRRAAPAGSAR